MAYTELLPYLIQKSLVFPRKLNQLVTYPPNFKHNAICVYHDGSSGHTTENYKAFRYRVQELINQKILSFADSTNALNKPTPWSYNITTNIRGNTKEAGNEFEEVATNEESEKEDSKDCHIDSEEHDNPNLWVGKVRSCINLIRIQQPLKEVQYNPQQTKMQEMFSRVEWLFLSVLQYVQKTINIGDVYQDGVSSPTR
ncbi:hypothetical protein KIW84_052869 [Lathyrus oleraceus]|uniref:Uncharacterized protein n=1 Tax=Pisum sativum TaxID=3888 RepID=A0A9D4WNS1_PEA|nr:hypothetical protein KIW84_052869 [Pisum sativum]